MKNYIVIKKTNKDIDEKTLELFEVVSFSTGDGLELSQRSAYDYSKHPQSLVFRRKNTALTATMRLQFDTNETSKRNIKLFDYISDLMDTTGRRCDLFYNGQNLGLFVIESIQFSGNCDATTAFNTMNVSIAFTEGFVRRETLYSEVSTL